MVPMAEESIDVPYWLLLSLKWLLAAGVTVGSAVGMHWIASKYRPGWARFCAAVPVLLAIHAVPLIFDPVVEPISVLAAAFLSCRLASGKVSVALGSTSCTSTPPMQDLHKLAPCYFAKLLHTSTVPHQAGC